MASFEGALRAQRPGRKRGVEFGPEAGGSAGHLVLDALVGAPSAEGMLGLQRSVGNAATTAFLQGGSSTARPLDIGRFGVVQRLPEEEEKEGEVEEAGGAVSSESESKEDEDEQ